MMVSQNTKPMVRSHDDITDFFNIVAGVLQEDTQALFLFTINVEYVLQTSIDLIKKWFNSKNNSF